MNSTFSTALLISTYNTPKILDLILLSISKQSVLPNEILIADDGSTEETTQIVEKYQKSLSIPIIHVWHEDKGFRKSMIINKAIAKSFADYIIQVDGDCIAHPDFIKDHKANAKKGLYLYGTRVHIKEEFVQEVTNKFKVNFSFFSLLLKKRFRALHIPSLSFLFKEQEEISPKFRGCNTSFWKEDFIKINGYNEEFEGWGREDSELMIRMHNNGINGKRLKFCGIVYHLDHPEKDRSNFKLNDKIQAKTEKKLLKTITKGINQYL